MRGGQITIFVLLGVVMLFVVGLLYLVISLNQAAEDPTGTTNQAILSTTIESCIDSVVIDELHMLGSAGGLVDFTGYPSAVVDTGARQTRMLYGITHNMGDDGFLPVTVFEPPTYPNENVAFQNTEQNPATGNAWPSWSNGYFGDVHIPGLCEKEGTNAPDSIYACTSYPGSPPGTPGPSQQAELESRIGQRVQACASPELFAATFGQEVETVSQPETILTFTAANTLVQLTYELQLVGETSTRVEKFSRVYDVRYQPVVQFATDLARKDTRDISFSMTEDYREIPSYLPGFTVLRTSDVKITEPSPDVRHAKADIITVIDAGSVLDGSSYAFSFLVEHRGPMLGIMTIADFQQVLAGNYEYARVGDPDDGPVEVVVCTSCSPPQVQAIDADGDMDWQAIP